MINYSFQFRALTFARLKWVSVAVPVAARLIQQSAAAASVSLHSSIMHIKMYAAHSALFTRRRIANKRRCSSATRVYRHVAPRAPSHQLKSCARKHDAAANKCETKIFCSCAPACRWICIGTRFIWWDLQCSRGFAAGHKSGCVASAASVTSSSPANINISRLFSHRNTHTAEWIPRAC